LEWNEIKTISNYSQTLPSASNSHCTLLLLISWHVAQ